MRKDETLACKTFRLLEQNAVFWQRPTFIAKFQSLPRQISKCRGHFENLREKKEKNRIASNKCDICTLDLMIDFHSKKIRLIGEGPKFALSVLMRTAS